MEYESNDKEVIVEYSTPTAEEALKATRFVHNHIKSDDLSRPMPIYGASQKLPKFFEDSALNDILLI